MDYQKPERPIEWQAVFSVYDGQQIGNVYLRTYQCDCGARWRGVPGNPEDCPRCGSAYYRDVWLTREE